MTDADMATSGGLSPLKRALLAIEDLQTKLDAVEAKAQEPIAVVGLGCRFPAGGDPEAFIESLLAGRDAIRPRPPVERRGWRETALDHHFPHPPAGFLDTDIAAFDAAFFGISPREAASIDPQQRLLLEVVWETLEDAGIDPRSLEGTRTGVFVGMASDDYAQLQIASERVSELLSPHYASGIGHSMASGRIAYLLGLQGPALTVDTACSSSLVALHLACQSLRAHESDAAFAAGTNLMMSGDLTRAFAQSRMLSPDGRCKAFSASADGFGRGEGCGVVMLKRLGDARRDHDRVLALVRGSAINQDGASSGLTAPNGPAQERVIRAALRQAGLTPDDVGYVEAHGTGTELGDPIEARALGGVYSKRSTGPLLVGSVKANMGHLEAAAGIAGFIKVVQSLRRRAVPPHLHLAEPSPHIPWGELGIEVVSSRAPFPVTGTKRRAGVSSFGFSGTNAHVIVEEAPEPAAPTAEGVDEGPQVLTLSARTETGLRALAERYADHLRASEVAFGDICRTANAGRSHFECRLGLVARDRLEAIEKLEAWFDGRAASGVAAGQLSGPDRPRVAFLYSGQGGQHPGMGWRDAAPAPFRTALETCADLLRDDLDEPLLDVLDPSDSRSELVHRTDYTQPAIFALQVAQTELWRSRGVHSHVVLGHSIGEYAAAYFAGVFRLEDALKLVAARGRFMQAVDTAGRMVAVMSGEGEVARWVETIGGPLSIAAVNAPGQVVVSGEAEAVSALETLAAEAGVAVRPLRTSQAFHSPLMDEAASRLGAVLEGIELRPATAVRMISTVTGRRVAADELADRGYWLRQLRAPVRFFDAVVTATATAEVAVEIGPHRDLAGLLRQADVPLSVSPSMLRSVDPAQTMAEAAVSLYAAGSELDWVGLDGGRTRRRVDLPHTAFQRTPLWVELGSGGRTDPGSVHPLMGSRRPRPGPTVEFGGTLRDDSPAFIGDHRVLGRVILPGTSYLEVALAAGKDALGRAVEVTELDLLAAMIFEDGPRRIHVVFAPEGTDTATFEIHSAADAVGQLEWVQHARGRVSVEPSLGDGRAKEAEALVHARARCVRSLSAGEFYDDLAARGYAFGALLRTVQEVEVGEGEAVARIELPQGDAREAYEIHPLILDGALQTLGSVLGVDGKSAYLPVAVDRFSVRGRPGTTAWAHATVTSRGEETVTARVAVYGDDGKLDALLEGVSFRRVSSPDQIAVGVPPVLHVRWTREPESSAATSSDEARDAVFARAIGVMEHEAESPAVAAYDRFTIDLEQHAIAYGARALHDLGWNPKVEAEIAADALADELGVVQGRRRLLARILEALAAAGVLVRRGDLWAVTGDLSSFQPEHVAVAAVADADALSMSAERVILDRCGPHLAECLGGRGDPLELLFPGGDKGDAERMYHDSPLARVFGRAVAEAVVEAAIRAPEGRPLRVLEVGGGTGGTTRHVLARLREPDARALPVEYTFTDVSRVFVDALDVATSEGTEVRRATLDLDSEPETQGFDLGSYDVVVAANSLHAAKDLRSAVVGVGRLLRPGGLLVAVEVFAPHFWFDLTVGLTDGWWHFSDEDLRPGYPCIGREDWERVLASSGFGAIHVGALGRDDSTHDLGSHGQGLVLATRSQQVREGASPWLVVTGEHGLGAEVANRLSSEGTDVRRIDPSTLVGEAGDARITEVLASAPRWAGILHCVERDDVESPDPTMMTRRLERQLGSLLTIARSVAASPAPIERIAVVTRGGQVVDAHDADTDPVSAALWGMARTVRFEVADIACACLDLDPTTPSRAVGDVVGWLTDPWAEAEVALRRGARLVRRLVDGTDVTPFVDPSLPDEYRLSPPESGSPDDLALETGRRIAPGPGQVEIRVAASGLNFKDVLNVLGMYPGDPGPLGSECSGIVTAAGPGTELSVGTPVVAVAGHAFGRHVLADARLVGPLPKGLSFAEAATLPIAYLTAYFALVHLGRIGPGDRILIHAAAGGVGSAACVVAQRAGAQVLATAGSEAKREAVRLRGIEHVFDSRSDGFVDGVMEATGGEGVTVVLNSLADELVDRSFDVLAHGGRFLEIGKRGIWSHERVAGLERSIEYHVIDWGRSFDEDPERVSAVWSEVMDAVARGDFGPLPADLFEVERVADAFRYMARARHTGKVILVHPVLDARKPLRFDSGGSYLVTGGTSGIGLESAAWAVDEGAGTVLLIGRSDPSPEASRVVQELNGHGSVVVPRRCDVGDAAAVTKLIEEVRKEFPPIRGVIHSAGVLADRPIDRSTWSDFEAVLRAKAYGPLHLARALQNEPLDFFVAYSSIASVLGSSGQANHAASNALLDAFVATLWRREATGMSLAWGPWAETGAATRDGVLDRTRALGIDALSNSQGRACLARAFESPEPLLVPLRVMDVSRLDKGRKDRLLCALRSKTAPGRSDGTEDVRPREESLSSRVAAAAVDGRRGLVLNHVRERARGVLGMPIDVALDPDRPMGDFGLDSLLAVELRNVLGEDVGQRLPSTLVFDHPTVTDLADHLLGLLDEGSAAGDASPSPAAMPSGALDSVEAMSDDDVDRLLFEKLEDHV